MRRIANGAPLMARHEVIKPPRPATTLGVLLRYYQVGLVNTGFGFGCYAGLVALGLNIFAAQLVAYALGAVFNYGTYRRYVFVGAAPAATRFALSYLANYLLSAVMLAGMMRLTASPYVGGLATVIIVSILNYVALKRLVFAR